MIVCVIGTTSSGKTYAVDNCFPQPLWIVGRPGRMIRESVGMFPAVTQKNPNRWDLTEDLVRNYVLDLLSVACELNRPLVLDGFPRDRQQAEWFFPKASVHGVTVMKVGRPIPAVYQHGSVEFNRHEYSVHDVEDVLDVAEHCGVRIEEVKIPWKP
jgi:hypothetical protein